MKLIIIILCLLSERYLIHNSSLHRFSWFEQYCQKILRDFNLKELNNFLIFFIVIAPIILAAIILNWLFSYILFGVLSFLFSLLIFYYSLGPKNVFYPEQNNMLSSEKNAKNYLAEVNGQLFSVIFWYVLAGPIMALLYRLTALCQGIDIIQKPAKLVTNYLDWIPSRITLLLYLLVGNFQQGFPYFSAKFFSAPENNYLFLTQGGYLAANHQQEEFTIIKAETIVDHAIILYIVFLSMLCLAALL